MLDATGLWNERKNKEGEKRKTWRKTVIKQTSAANILVSTGDLLFPQSMWAILGERGSVFCGWAWCSETSTRFWVLKRFLQQHLSPGRIVFPNTWAHSKQQQLYRLTFKAEQPKTDDLSEANWDLTITQSSTEFQNYIIKYTVGHMDDIYILFQCFLINRFKSAFLTQNIFSNHKSKL